MKPTAECMYCIMFLPDVVIPESPEAYVKLTEQTLRSSTGRQQQTPACHVCLGPEIRHTLSDKTRAVYLVTSLELVLCSFPHLNTLWAHTAQMATVSNTGE